MKSSLAIIGLIILQLVELNGQNQKLKIKDTLSVNKPDSFHSLPVSKDKNLPEDVVEILEYRAVSYDFFTTSVRMAELSTLSWLGTDYHRNTNPAWQKRNFVLNAVLAPVFALGGKQWIIPPTIGSRSNPLGGMMFAIHILPEFKVRIFNEDTSRGDVSLPVRTPSFMAGPELFISHRNLWKKDSKNHFLISFKGYHHSNGQDGLRMDTMNTPHHTNGYFNTYNGDFGDNWVNEFYFLWNHTGIRLNYNDTLLEKNRSILKAFRTSNEFYIKTGIGFHDYINNTMRDEHIYSRRRLNIKIGYIYAPSKRALIKSNISKKYYVVEKYRAREKLRATLNIVYLGDGTGLFGLKYYSGPVFDQKPVKPFDMSKRLNIYGTVHFRFSSTANTTLFAQGGYYGSDQYNAYFMESMWFFRFGVGLGFLKFSNQDEDSLINHPLSK